MLSENPTLGSPVNEGLPVKIPLHKPNLRQYIDFLRETFPGLTITTIVELADMKWSQIDSLLYDRSHKHIRPQEVKALFQVYEDLKSGKKTYEPTKKISFMPQGVLLHKPNLCQYIDFLQGRFHGLSISAIAKLAGMNEERLYELLENKDINDITVKEAEALFKVYKLLEQIISLIELIRQGVTGDIKIDEKIIDQILEIRKAVQ